MASCKAEKLAKKLGLECGNVRNGQILRLAPNGPEIVDETISGRIYKDGDLLISSEEPVRERRRLAFAGVVSIAIAIDNRGDVAGDAEIQLSGLPAVDAEGDTFVDIVHDTALDALDNLPRQKRRDAEFVAEALRRAVRAEINAVWGKKPLVQVLVVVV